MGAERRLSREDSADCAHHLTDAMQDWIERIAKIPVDDTNMAPDVYIIELGGTVGDIESALFIEAMR